MEKIDLHPEKENQQGKKKKGPHGCSPQRHQSSSRTLLRRLRRGFSSSTSSGRSGVESCSRMRSRSSRGLATRRNCLTSTLPMTSTSSTSASCSKSGASGLKSSGASRSSPEVILKIYMTCLRGSSFEFFVSSWTKGDVRNRASRSSVMARQGKCRQARQASRGR